MRLISSGYDKENCPDVRDWLKQRFGWNDPLTTGMFLIRNGFSNFAQE